MSEENVETVRGAYDDFNSGNIPGVLGRMDPDVEWTEPGGGNAAAGTFKGPDAVGQEVFATVPENFDDFSVEVLEAKDEGDTVIVKSRFKGKPKGGGEMDLTATQTWEVKDGKITKTDNKPNDQGAWAKAWGG